MGDTTRIESLNVLLDPSGKMLLKETYDGVIANVQKNAISTMLKNTDLSGNPEAGTVEAKRFKNAEAADYGTARAAGKGSAAKGKPVTIAIDKNREFVEEVEQKDVSLLGVEGLIQKRAANHQLRMAAELDEAFFAEGKTAGTSFTPSEKNTAIQDIIEESIVTLETLKTDYIDGVPREMISVTCDPATYSDMRKYLDTISNSNVDSAQGEFTAFHGVKIFSSNRLPSGCKFETMVDGSIAQPVMSKPYTAEKIPLSEAFGISLFFYYGTKAVTPELILQYSPV
jgi:hypothetical protein